MTWKFTRKGKTTSSNLSRVVILLCFIGYSCTDSNDQLLLKTVTDSGITFSNDILTTDTFNILNFHYIYNGGGVGVGDFDKNGLPDLVFSGNQVPSKLYLNQGSLTFKDISETPRGIVLVTGPTGSGKSTTLAGMINYKNENQNKIDGTG